MIDRRTPHAGKVVSARFIARPRRVWLQNDPKIDMPKVNRRSTTWLERLAVIERSRDARMRACKKEFHCQHRLSESVFQPK